MKHLPFSSLCFFVSIYFTFAKIEWTSSVDQSAVCVCSKLFCFWISFFRWLAELIWQAILYHQDFYLWIFLTTNINTRQRKIATRVSPISNKMSSNFLIGGYHRHHQSNLISNENSLNVPIYSCLIFNLFMWTSFFSFLRRFSSFFSFFF